MIHDRNLSQKRSWLHNIPFDKGFLDNENLDIGRWR